MTNGWHQADIIAGLRKKGTSLAALSRAACLSSSTPANALTRPWPKEEFLIADVLGVLRQKFARKSILGRTGNRLIERV
ncbi:DNA-binding transcriptional regulator Nlp [Buttiauxella agrestis]|uniref:DNA-binding transcriptional regulator Nlp n=1 Tax=Buttiauxella agrestis TaxID=82977 RepID=A0A381CC94_9ENTR|nr:DNA-binding transcriptional regulator Nlp [Buttiauxella agrestis]